MFYHSNNNFQPIKSGRLKNRVQHQKYKTQYVLPGWVFQQTGFSLLMCMCVCVCVIIALHTSVGVGRTLSISHV